MSTIPPPTAADMPEKKVSAMAVQVCISSTLRGTVEVEEADAARPWEWEWWSPWLWEWCPCSSSPS